MSMDDELPIEPIEMPTPTHVAAWHGRDPEPILYPIPSGLPVLPLPNGVLQVGSRYLLGVTSFELRILEGIS